jgi:ATP-dependent DNA ligase
MARPIARRGGAAPPGLPDWIRTQLTELVDVAPDGPDWLHEIKYDGYRMHARLDRGAARLLTRTGLDWTHKYPTIAKAVASLGRRRAQGDAPALLHTCTRPPAHRLAAELSDQSKEADERLTPTERHRSEQRHLIH